MFSKLLLIIRKEVIEEIKKMMTKLDSVSNDVSNINSEITGALKKLDEINGEVI